MAKKRSKKKKKQEAGSVGGSAPQKGGMLVYVPAFCSLIGTLMLLVVIALAIPLTVPNYLGYQVYNVVSGSMEPAIPIGSVIYVKAIDPVEIKKGDVIAFRGGDSVIMHRVVDNKMVEGTFTTKGDANEGQDMNEVPYANLVGIVVRHIPILGQLLILFGSSFGRLCMICFAACGALLNVLGGRYRDTMEYEAERDRERAELLAETLQRKHEADAAREAAQKATAGPERESIGSEAPEQESAGRKDAVGPEGTEQKSAGREEAAGPEDPEQKPAGGKEAEQAAAEEVSPNTAEDSAKK